MIFFVVRLMGKNISFLFLASILLSTNSNAMEDTPSVFNQIRLRYNLPIGNSYNIPEKIQTGHFLELYQPEKPQFTLDPNSSTFYEDLRGTVLTPAALYELLPLEQQGRFFEALQEEGSQIDLFSSVTEFKNNALRRQVNLSYSKFFLTSLNEAIPVIPSSLFQYCPVTLIVDQQFSKQNDHLSLAHKYESLGLAIKDVQEGITTKNRHYLMSESFGKAGDHFFGAAMLAKESGDIFSVPDLLISAGLCYEWSAVRCLNSNQAKEKLRLAQDSIHEGFKALSPAYKGYRKIATEGEHSESELAKIKDQLNSYVTWIVSWSKDFDPLFFNQLSR